MSRAAADWPGEPARRRRPAPTGPYIPAARMRRPGPGANPRAAGTERANGLERVGRGAHVTAPAAVASPRPSAALRVLGDGPCEVFLGVARAGSMVVLLVPSPGEAGLN